MIRTTACRCARKSLQRWGVDMLKVGDRVRLKRQAVRDIYIDRRQRGIVVATDGGAGLVITVSFERVVSTRGFHWNYPVCVTAADLELWQ